MKRILLAVTFAILSLAAHARIEVSTLVDDRAAANMIAGASQSFTIVINSMYPGRTTPIPIEEYKSHGRAGNQNFAFRFQLLDAKPAEALAAFEYEKSKGKSLSQDEINDFINSTELDYYKQVVEADPDLAEFIANEANRIHKRTAADRGEEVYWQCGEMTPQVVAGSNSLSTNAQEYQEFLAFCSGKQIANATPPEADESAPQPLPKQPCPDGFSPLHCAKFGFQPHQPTE